MIGGAIMALGKNIPTRYGIEAFYWRIVLVKETYDKQETLVVFLGYVNESARNNPEVDALDSIEITLSQTDLTREMIYNIVKNDELTSFYGALDLL